jgi:NADPH:quinone reductase-like Zn-dependent oxidoreductase
VIGTAAAHNLGFVRGLGADQVIDYRATRFEDAVPDLDVVFDTVGGETLERSWGVLRAGGRLVTVAASSEGARDPRSTDVAMTPKDIIETYTRRWNAETTFQEMRSYVGLETTRGGVRA